MTVPTFPCDSCGRLFEYAMGRYRGRPVPAYGIIVCDGCYEGNWDGWGPAREPKIIARMTELGRPLPPRNEEGLLPRDG
jgi:hypothetical protein